MHERRVRALRGTAAAGLAVFVAALFHVAGGGAVPGALGIVAALGLATPFSVLLARPGGGLWRTAVSVAGSQLAFHLLFTLGRPSSVRVVGDTGMPGMPGMSGAGLHLVGTAGTASAASSVAGPAMYLGHALAALVTIAALRHGERTLRRMLELTARFLVRALALVSTSPLPRLRVAVTAAPAPVRTPAALLGTLRHRGPPILFVSVTP